MSAMNIAVCDSC